MLLYVLVLQRMYSALQMVFGLQEYSSKAKLNYLHFEERGKGLRNIHLS